MERGVRPRAGRSVVAQEDNRMLDKIRVGINQAYRKIADRDNYVTAEKVRNAYLGLGMNHETLLAVFRQHNEDYENTAPCITTSRSLPEISPAGYAINPARDLPPRHAGQLPVSWPDGFFRFIFKREFHRISDPVACARGAFLFFQIMYRLIVEPVNALYHGRADSSKM